MSSFNKLAHAIWQCKRQKLHLGRHFWATERCVSTVGFNEEEVGKYVRWQLERDKRIKQFKLW